MDTNNVKSILMSRYNSYQRENKEVVDQVNAIPNQQNCWWFTTSNKGADLNALARNSSSPFVKTFPLYEMAMKMSSK